jgi:hypothetical protein
MHVARSYHEIVPADPLHLPVISREKAGVKRSGSIVPELQGDQVVLRSNVCRAEVGNINAAILSAWQQAIADQIVITKFDELGRTRNTYVDL